MRFILNAAVFLLVISGLQYWVGWEQLLQPWSLLGLDQIILVVTWIVVSYLIRAWRFQQLFPQVLSKHLFGVVRLTLLHTLLNNLLPARTGELSFPFLMKHYFAVPVMQSSVGLLWLRLLDLHTVILVALFGLQQAAFGAGLGGLFCLLWLALPWCCLGLGQWVQRQSHRVDRLGFMGRKLSTVGPIQPSIFYRVWLLTLMNWGVKLFALAWLLGQFLQQGDLGLWLGAIVASEMTSVLPLHAPAGLGTYEIGAVAVLAQSITLPWAVACVFNVHLLILGSSVCGGLLAGCMAKPSSQGRA